MRSVVAVFALAGCGRVAFDPLALRDGGGSGTDDAPNDDARPDDAPSNDASLPAGLVALYTLDSNQTISDSIGDRDGTCTACPTDIPGHIGEGQLFDGTDDCITVTDHGTFQLPQITLAMWARQDLAGTISQIAKRTVGGSVNSWQLESDPVGGDPNTLSFTTYDGSGMNVYAISPDNAITIGAWHHIAATFDGSTKRLYIDGTQSTFVTGHPALIYDNMPVKIGCDDNAPESRFWNGALDEIQIYNRALSAAEIAYLAAL